MRLLATLSILALAACSETAYDAASDDPTAADAQPGEVEASTETPEATASNERPDLEQIWVTGGFSAPEGVATDGDSLYISNVAGEAADKDGEGWISRVSLQGELLEEKWVSGLNAPKGMAIRDGKLFVSDYDAYHVIDIATAQIDNTYPVDGAGFLNDITIWQNGEMVEIYRTSPEALPRLSEVMAKAATAVEQVTGCRVREGSLVGDAALMKATLDCG